MEDHWGSVHTEERPHENTVRRQESANQGERPQENLNLLIPDLGLLATRTMRSKCLLFKPAHLWYFVTAA